MPEYRLSPDAEEDLLEIALYTIETWGVDQAHRYGAALESCFDDIARGRARTRAIFDHRPEIQVCRHEHHFIFALVEEGRRPLILAIFHGAMDLLGPDPRAAGTRRSGCVSAQPFAAAVGRDRPAAQAFHASAR